MVKSYKSYIYILSLGLILGITSNPQLLLSTNDYITGDDGVVRMPINIIGNVQKPGVYLLYDGIDFLSAISQAGGYLEGSNLSEIMIYSTDGTHKSVKLKHLHDKNYSDNSFMLKPSDTIHIKQKTISKIFTSSNIPSLIISIMNLAITLERK